MGILFLIIALLGLSEFYALLERANYRPQKYIGLLVGFGIIGLELYTFYGSILFPVLGFFFVELFRKTQKPLENIALSMLGIIYVVTPFFLLIHLSKLCEYHPATNIILGFFFLMWSNDTFAYLIGKPFGRTKLFERISPKKTWEGFIGGLVLTQGVAYILSIYFTQLPLRDWMVIGAIVSVFGTLGDLVESMFKRNLDIKDSGSILPGHGGILDRFDGVFLSAPFMVAYLWLIR